MIVATSIVIWLWELWQLMQPYVYEVMGAEGRP